MKKEDLFEGFGSLDDELLKRSEQGGSIMKKGRSFNKILKFVSIAACLVVVLGVGAILTNNKTPDILNGQSKTQEEKEKFVNVETLLASGEGVREQSLILAQVKVKGYEAIYHKVASVDSIILKESTGSEVEETQNWYKVSGHEDKQYLISRDNNEYSLWKFHSFQGDSYPYNDVLQIIYNIYSADDITEIIVYPANMDNTDEGKAIQREIGTRTITDYEKIDTLYNILSGLTCYGIDNWDMIGLGDDSPSSMQNKVKVGRYLKLVTSLGMEIDTLKYTGISGMFYEFGGIAYSALNMDERTAVEDILNIEPVTSNTVSDASVEEKTYHEARDYSVELTDLQNRIGEAMMNKELPFVISSAILENPDRIHVEVTTKEKELIEKLKAFNTTGELLEIVYSENTPVKEYQ